MTGSSGRRAGTFPDGSRLYVADSGGKVRIHDATTGKEVATLAAANEPDDEDDDPLSRIPDRLLGRAKVGIPLSAVSPDGRWLATGSWDRTVGCGTSRPDNRS